MSIRKGRLTSTALSIAPVNFPVGSVLQFAGTVAPDGWVLCDGSAISRSSYPSLFSVIGTTHGIGDGSTTFNVPDYRYQVPRGRGGVSDRTFAPTDVNISTEEITITGHSYRRTGFRVRISSTGTIVGGLATGTDYYVIIINANTIKLATTRANALAGTAINLTSQGTGTHTISQAEGADYASRTSVNSGNSGDNVGSLEEDNTKSHRHTVRGTPNAPVGGSLIFHASNWAPSGTGVATIHTATESVGLTGGTETRINNILTNFIIKV